MRRARARSHPSFRARFSAEDLEQSVLLHLLDRDRQALRQYDPGRGRLVPFVAKVAFFRALDTLGRQVGAIDAPDEAVSPLSHLEQRDQLRRILGYLTDSLHRRSDLLVLQALITDEPLRDLALRTGFSRAYLDKCAWRVRRLAREWRAQNA